MTKKRDPIFTLEQRFEHGIFSLYEAAELANRSVSQLYFDAAAGRIEIRKIGWRSGIPGPILRRLIRGESEAA